MLCCIDIGNTNIVIGLWSNDTWSAKWRIQTLKDRMPDEYVVLLKALLHEYNFQLHDIEQTIICSVVPRLKSVFGELFKNYRGINPLFLGPGVKSGIKIRTDNPVEVGADLVSDAVAAYNLFKGACIVVDFGTATTFSAISDNGELLGVAIAPGLEVAAEALSSKAAKLPMIDLVPPKKCIGTNTVESLQSGLLYGYVGLVEGLIKKIRKEMGKKAPVVATGGLSKILYPLTGYIDKINTELTLEGLKIVDERNFGYIE